MRITRTYKHISIVAIEPKAEVSAWMKQTKASSSLHEFVLFWFRSQAVLVPDFEELQQMSDQYTIEGEN